MSKAFVKKSKELEISYLITRDLNFALW